MYVDKFFIEFENKKNYFKFEIWNIKTKTDVVYSQQIQKA